MTYVAPAGPGDRLPEEAAEVVRRTSTIEPVAGVVLGSGLGGSLEGFEPEAVFAFVDLPGFPRATAPSHAGRLELGRLDGVPVAVFRGRLHFYEGNLMTVAALPARLAHALGVRAMILTAAVGALDPALSVGTVVVGTDHINLMGENPLRGWRFADGTPAFVDLSEVYDRTLAEIALERAGALGLPAASGVYAAMAGPSFETPAEVEFLRRAGATVVGMSVVPEAVPARALGMRVVGLFAVTNEVGGQISYLDVLEKGEAAAAGVGRLVAQVVARTV